MVGLYQQAAVELTIDARMGSIRQRYPAALDLQRRDTAV